MYPIVDGTAVASRAAVSSPTIAPSPPRLSSRSSRAARARARLWRRLGLAAFYASIAVVAALTMYTRDLELPSPSLIEHHSESGASEQPLTPTAAEIGLLVRPVYKHSVIPGGVLQPTELQRAMSLDQVVAEHFKGVEPGRLLVEHVRDPFLAYVSYRIGDKVYWTSQRLLIRSGERVLTDGTTSVRARCGNAISMEPREPVAANEPSPDALDQLDEVTALAAMRPEDPKPAGAVPPMILAQALGPELPPVGSGFMRDPEGRAVIGG